MIEQLAVELDLEIGELQFGGRPVANRKPREDGSFEIFEPNDQRMMSILGNQNWHTDSSYMPVSAKCGALSALAWTIELSGWLTLAAVAAGSAALWVIRHLAGETGRVYRALRMMPSPMDRILDHDALGPHFAEELARMSGKS